jgi:hypothetical protein
MQLTAAKIKNNLFMVLFSNLEKVEVSAKSLSYVTRQAYHWQESDFQLRAAERLINLSPRTEHEGRYFYALAQSRMGKSEFEKACDEFKDLSDHAPIQIRAAATLATGLNLLAAGHMKEAFPRIIEANKMSLSSHLCAPIIAFDSLNWMSTIKSLEGDHEGSLKMMRGLIPLLRVLGRAFPLLICDYWNNCAYDLSQLGELDSASHLINKLKKTPYFGINSDYNETFEEIEQKKNLLLSPYRHKIYLPDPDAYLISVTPLPEAVVEIATYRSQKQLHQLPSLKEMVQKALFSMSRSSLSISVIFNEVRSTLYKIALPDKEISGPIIDHFHGTFATHGHGENEASHKIEIHLDGVYVSDFKISEIEFDRMDDYIRELRSEFTNLWLERSQGLGKPKGQRISNRFLPLLERRIKNSANQ